jgi:hypothetical protein
MDKQSEPQEFKAKPLAQAKIGPGPADTQKVLCYLEPGVKLSSALGTVNEKGLAAASRVRGVVDRREEKGLKACPAGAKILDVVS